MARDGCRQNSLIFKDYATKKFVSSFQSSRVILSFRSAARRRRTAEMTWGETATTQAKGNGQRDNKVAVSPSRPLTCSVRHYEELFPFLGGLNSSSDKGYSHS